MGLEKRYTDIMDEIKEMLRAVINAQHALKSELLTEIAKAKKELRQEMKEGFEKVDKRFEKVDANLDEVKDRLDKQRLNSN